MAQNILEAIAVKIFCKVLAACLVVIFFGTVQAQPLVSVFSDDVRFCESILPYDGGLFISNFGSATMNPRPDENSGYIIFRKDGVNKKIVDGLHKPTAMSVKDNFLIVCDETVLKVFDLANIDAAPQIVTFAADDKVVNALARDGDTLYISITNSGRIYSLDISNPARLGNVSPKLWLELGGANGMTIGGGEMFIATIPVDYRTVAAGNVIYRVRDLKKPVAEKFYDVPGLYDGVALSDDGKTLYISDWLTASVAAVDIATKNFRVIYAEAGIGPADIAQADGTLFIPELVNSRVICISVGK